MCTCMCVCNNENEFFEKKIERMKRFIGNFFFLQLVLNGNLSKVKKISGPNRFHITQVLLFVLEFYSNVFENICPILDKHINSNQ